CAGSPRDACVGPATAAFAQLSSGRTISPPDPSAAALPLARRLIGLVPSTRCGPHRSGCPSPLSPARAWLTPCAVPEVPSSRPSLRSTAVCALEPYYCRPSPLQQNATNLICCAAGP